MRLSKNLLSFFSLIKMCALVCALAFSTQSLATHIVGMRIFYKHLSGNDYEVTAHFYRYCGGSAFNGVPTNASTGVPTHYTYYWNGGANSSNEIMTIDTAYSLEFYCPNNASMNSCSIGWQTGFFGVEVSVMKDTLSITQPGMLMYSTGARNSGSNYFSQPGISVYTTIDPASGNSSAAPISLELPFLSADSILTTYSLQCFDPDGDSLVYELDTAWNGYNSITGFTPIAYQSPYTAFQPIDSAYLDPQIGLMTALPQIPQSTLAGNYAIAYKVLEYDPQTGVLKGVTHFDFQTLVVEDTLKFDPYPSSGLFNVQGANQSGSQSIASCAGTSFCYSVTFADSNLGDTLSGILDFDSNQVSASLTQTGVNPATFEVCGQVLVGTTSQVSIDLVVSDDHCPFIGKRSFGVAVITGCTQVDLDTLSLCQGGWLDIDMLVDSTVVWSVLSGSAIANGTNFNCLNASCSQVEVSPANTTTYAVQKYTTVGLVFHDTFTVVVSANPNILISQIGDACAGEQFELALDVTNANGFIVQWTDTAGILDSLNDPNVFVNASAGTYAVDYWVQVAGTCMDSGTYMFTVNPSPQWPGLLGPAGAVCKGKQFQIETDSTLLCVFNPSTGLTDSIGSPYCTLFGPQTYTIDFTDANGCSNTTTETFSPEGNFIRGSAEDTSGSAVTSGNAILVGIDPVNAVVFIVDQDSLDASGEFLLEGTDSVHAVKIVPDSATYPNLIPTYFYSEPTIQNADLAITNYCDTVDIDVIVLDGPNPGGTGFVGGSIFSGGGRDEGDPVPGLPVVLMDEDLRMVGWSQTNDSGYFSFGNLNPGKFYVWVDKYSIQNKYAPPVLVESGQVVDSLEFILYSDKLVIQYPTGEENITADHMVVFPNPTSDVLTIQFPAVSASIQVYDLTGRLIHQAAFNSSASLRVAGWNEGIYILQLQMGDMVKTERIVVTRH